MRFHDFIRDTDGWRLVGDDTLFASPHLEVHSVTVTSPTRPTPFKWTVTHRKAAVVIVPMLPDGRLLLVRQERVPIRATIWEFPAGQIDDASSDDAVRSTALRELAEESGYELAPGGELVQLGHYFPSCGFTDEHSYLVLTRPIVAVEGGAKPDAAEAITESTAFSPEQLRAMIASGEVRDANTLAGFARMVAMGFLK